MLESTPECNLPCLHSVDSTRMLNANNTDYIDYVLGYSPKWQKTVTRGEELLNQLWYYGLFKFKAALGNFFGLKWSENNIWASTQPASVKNYHI